MAVKRLVRGGHRFEGFRCPTNPEHGLLHHGKDGEGASYRCPHAAHDGRPNTHPLGFAPQTRCTFSVIEAEEGNELPQEGAA